MMELLGIFETVLNVVILVVIFALFGHLAWRGITGKRCTGPEIYNMRYIKRRKEIENDAVHLKSHVYVSVLQFRNADGQWIDVPMVNVGE